MRNERARRRATYSGLRAIADSSRWGWFRRGILWARRQARHLRLTRSESDVLAIIASYCDPVLWGGFRVRIEDLAALARWSRSTVERALRRLRQLGLLVRTGQIPVSFGRPVVVYALGSTPECPLPEDVVRAREEAREERVSCSEAETTHTNLQAKGKDAVPGNPWIRPWIEHYRNQRKNAWRERTPLPSPSLPKDWFAGGERSADMTPVWAARPSGFRRKLQSAWDLIRPTKSGRTRGPVSPQAPRASAPECPGVNVVTYATNNPRTAGGFVTNAEPLADALFELPRPSAGTAIVKASRKDPSPGRALPATAGAFADFWAHWPRKVSKTAAERAFRRLVEVEQVDPGLIVNAAREYRERWDLLKKEKDWTPYPATWLNGGRYEDDIDDALPMPASSRSKLDIIHQQNMEGLLRTCAEEGVDPSSIGRPAPSSESDFDPWEVIEL